MHPRYGRRLPLTHDQGLLLSKASWTVPLSTVVLAMLIHGLDNPRAVPFFISESDYPGLQDHVFSLGLSLAGLVQLVYAWHLYHALEAQHPALWFIATLFGLFAALNTVLVSHLDMYGFINPHIATAMMAFGGGLVWAYLAQRSLGDRASVEGKRMRRLGFLLALSGFVVMVTSFQMAVSTFDPSGMSTEAFLNQAQHGIRFAAPAEYVLVTGLLVCLASFRHDLLSQQASTGDGQD